MACRHMIHFNSVPFLFTFEYPRGVPFCQGWLSSFCWMRAAFVFCCPRHALNFVSCVGTGASALSHPLSLRRAWQLSPSSMNGFSGPGLPYVPWRWLFPQPSPLSHVTWWASPCRWLVRWFLQGCQRLLFLPRRLAMCPWEKQGPKPRAASCTLPGWAQYCRCG